MGDQTQPDSLWDQLLLLMGEPGVAASDVLINAGSSLTGTPAPTPASTALINQLSTDEQTSGDVLNPVTDLQASGLLPSTTSLYALGLVIVVVFVFLIVHDLKEAI